MLTCLQTPPSCADLQLLLTKLLLVMGVRFYSGVKFIATVPPPTPSSGWGIKVELLKDGVHHSCPTIIQRSVATLPPSILFPIECAQRTLGMLVGDRVFHPSPLKRGGVMHSVTVLLIRFARTVVPC